jgi:5'-3' exonuclease
VYIFRAWFSIPDSMTGPHGNPVNALYGYTRFLGDFLEKSLPAHVAVAFDESLTSSYRNEIYPDYKANREPAPEDLKRQFAACREITEALGVPQFSSSRFEADDLIGSLAAFMRGHGMPAVVVSRDKDLAQVIREGDEYWDYAGDRRIAYEDIEAEFGVRPERMADFLALTGDKVDNIPGVPGVGKKTASVLLHHFSSIDEIYARLEDVASLKLRGAKGLAARLDEHRDAAYLARELTRIPDDIDLGIEEHDLRRSPPDLARLDTLFDEHGIGRSAREQAARIARRFPG